MLKQVLFCPIAISEEGFVCGHSAEPLLSTKSIVYCLSELALGRPRITVHVGRVSVCLEWNRTL